MPRIHSPSVVAGSLARFFPHAGGDARRLGAHTGLREKSRVHLLCFSVAIRHSDGELYTHTDEVLSLAIDYFVALFMRDACSSEIVAAREEVWSHMRLVVMADMAATLMCLFTDTELHAAAAVLNASSCPRDDGIANSF